MFFLGGTPWNRPTGIITFFAINQEGVDQSFSSSNSTEISMRRFYARNFITIGLAFEALSCKRPDILTDSRVCSLFEYTKNVEIRSFLLSYVGNLLIENMFRSKKTARKNFNPSHPLPLPVCKYAVRNMIFFLNFSERYSLEKDTCSATIDTL